ncbi:MAG: metalloregulator ArsR/SmtB family transcription factor [Anaerolineaceae bacterium]
MDKLPQSNAGWCMRQSIALELDAVTSVLGGALFNRESAALREFAPFIQSIPPSWLEELEILLEDARGFHSTLETLAILADVIFESDYNVASTAMRSLTIPSVLNRVSELVGQHQGLLSAVPNEVDRLVEEFVQLQLMLFREVDVKVNREYRSALRQGIRFSLRIIQGGDLHDRFWDWLDRFYLQKYAGWRLERVDVIRGQEEQAAAALGVLEKAGTPPDLAWLSEQNPVLRHPGLKTAVENGSLSLCLWAEPIGLPDSWLLFPGTVVTSFARGGSIIEDFREFTSGLARRAAALSDPTRLIILRLIRNIDMTNTDMAEYLSLSRPTVSIHARILREAGLIRSHAEGRAVRHEIVSEEVHRLFKDLETFLDLPEKV